MLITRIVKLVSDAPDGFQVPRILWIVFYPVSYSADMHHGRVIVIAFFCLKPVNPCYLLKSAVF